MRAPCVRVLTLRTKGYPCPSSPAAEASSGTGTVSSVEVVNQCKHCARCLLEADEHLLRFAAAEFSRRIIATHTRRARTGYYTPVSYALYPGYDRTDYLALPHRREVGRRRNGGGVQS